LPAVLLLTVETRRTPSMRHDRWSASLKQAQPEEDFGIA
jgi:hypothetical protein